MGIKEGCSLHWSLELDQAPKTSRQTSPLLAYILVVRFIKYIINTGLNNILVNNSKRIAILNYTINLLGVLFQHILEYCGPNLQTNATPE